MTICDLDSDAGENACEELGQMYGKERLLFCHCDVTDYVQYEEAFQATISEFDRLDIVVNNAEIMNDKFWELEVDVNLVCAHRSCGRMAFLIFLRFQNGAIRGTLLALQYLGKDKGGNGGVVINIGSACSFRPQISTPIYTATKHAVLALSRSCGVSASNSVLMSVLMPFQFSPGRLSLQPDGSAGDCILSRHTGHQCRLVDARKPLQVANPRKSLATRHEGHSTAKVIFIYFLSEFDSEIYRPFQIRTRGKKSDNASPGGEERHYMDG